MRRAAGWEQDFFRVESHAGHHRRAADRRRSPPRPRSRCGSADAAAHVAHRRGQRPGQRHRHGAAGRASASRYPQLDRVHLTDYKVRILDGATATGAVTRVLIDSTDGERVVDHDRRQRRTSSRRRGRRSPTRSSTACCTPPRRPRPSRTGAMAAPEFVPVSPVDKPRVYESPDHVPDAWRPDRPAELTGRQPAGARLGYQGPDQGYALKLAERFRDRLQLQQASTPTTPSRGASGVALRRASLFGRAPIIHDLTVAFTIWGFLDPTPPAELVARRRPLFEGVRHVSHHYAERTGHRRRGAAGDAAQDPPAGGERVPERVAGAARRLSARAASTSRSSVAASPASRPRASWPRPGGRSSCWSRRSSWRTTPPAGRPRSSWRATGRRPSGPSRWRAAPTSTRRPSASARPRLLEARSALWIAPPSQLADLGRLVAEVPTLQTIAPSDAVARCRVLRLDRLAGAAIGARRLGHRRARAPPGLRQGSGRGRGDGRALGPRHRAGGRRRRLAASAGTATS